MSVAGKVLIVDDEPQIRRLVSGTLARAGSSATNSMARGYL